MFHFFILEMTGWRKTQDNGCITVCFMFDQSSDAKAAEIYKKHCIRQVSDMRYAYFKNQG